MWFNLCNEYDLTVAKAASSGWQFTYRRWLSDDLQAQKIKLRELLDMITLVPEDDIPVWDWTKNVQFAVKSVYKDLSSAGIDIFFKHLWKTKIPLKIKVWLWLICVMPLLQKIPWLKEDGQEILDVSFVCIISCSLALRLNMCGDMLQNPLVLKLDQFFWRFPQHVPAS
jgi:hypothetical protein